MLLILRDKPLRSTIFRTALPAMMEMILYMLIGIVDVAIVGRLGAAPLAAVALGAEIFFAVVLILEALGIGAAVLIAQAKGARDFERANRIASQTVLLGFIIGIAAAVLGLFYTEAILGFFNVEAAVFAQAAAYLHITFWVTPIALVFYMICTVYRGWGRTEIPMYMALAVNIVNVVGVYVLVYGKFGLPRMGVAGAGLAAVIAHVVGFALGAYLLSRGTGHLQVKWQWMRKIDLTIIKNIFSLGLPTFIEQFFNNFGTIVSVFFIVSVGTTAFAAHQVGVTVESLSFMPGIGIAIAATALVGRSVGARDKIQARRMARGTMEFAFMIMGGFGIIFALIPYHVAALFTNDQEIIRIAGLLLRIASLEQLTIAAAAVMGGILRGTGDTRTPMLISALLTWAYRLPMLYLVIHVFQLPIHYAWMVFVSDWFLRTLIFVVIFRRRFWSKKTGLKEKNPH